MTNRTRYIILGASALFIIFLAWYFSSIVTYIIISAILGMIGRPVVRWLQKVKIWKFRIGPTLSAFIALAVLWILFFSFFRFLIPLVISEFETLANVDINEYLKAIEKPISDFSLLVSGNPISFNEISFIDMVSTKFSSYFNVSKVSDMLGTIAGAVGEILIAIFSISFITFFFLREEGMFRNGLMLLSPSGYEERVEKSFDRISVLLRRYFVGIVLEVILVGGLDMLGLVIIGMDFHDAVVIGLVCGLFNVIPYLGPWMGATIGVLIGLAINIEADFMNQTLPFVGLMLVVFVIVQILDNVLFQPLIYSSSVKAHPMEIFLVIMAAGSLAGILGMILAIPVYTIFRVFGAEFLSNVKFVRKITENMETRK